MNDKDKLQNQKFLGQFINVVNWNIQSPNIAGPHNGADSVQIKCHIVSLRQAQL